MAVGCRKIRRAKFRAQNLGPLFFDQFDQRLCRVISALKIIQAGFDARYIVERADDAFSAVHLLKEPEGARIVLKRSPGVFEFFVCRSDRVQAVSLAAKIVRCDLPFQSPIEIMKSSAALTEPIVSFSNVAQLMGR